MRTVYLIPILLILVLSSCKKEDTQPTDKELIQSMLVGNYDMSCLTYSWQLGPDSTQPIIYSDSAYYYGIWNIQKAADSTDVLVNDTLMTSFELNKYYEVNGFTSRTLVLTFFEPDSITAHRKLGGGLGGGLNVECQGKKQ